MELNVVDVFARRGYRFAGDADVLSEAEPEFREVSAWVKVTNGEIYPVFDVIRLVPIARAGSSIPAYEIGHAEEAFLVHSYRSKYRLAAADPMCA